MKRILSTSLIQLTEASYNPTTGELLVTVIQPGLSKNNRFYPKEVLERDHRIFDGNKMFADHQTEAERKAKPEGSVNNWVAQLGKTWAEADGTIKGKATVIDPIFKAKLDTLAEKKLLNEMGISIRAVGTASNTTMQGKEVNNVESLLASRSVDFVTYAGAGGRVEMMEAENTERDLDLVDEAQLRSRRPDLVASIESAIKGDNMMTIEQQLAEANSKFEAEKAKNVLLTTANTGLVESAKAANKTAAMANLERLLGESKLPEASKKRLKAQFKEADKSEGMKEAIEAEESYVKEIGGKQVVKNLGTKDNISESAAGNEPKPEEMVKAYQALGMTEAEAKVAAGA